eukprot:1031001-Pleurochrysis_carterae.AAC.1
MLLRERESDFEPGGVSAAVAVGFSSLGSARRHQLHLHLLPRVRREDVHPLREHLMERVKVVAPPRLFQQGRRRGCHHASKRRRHARQQGAKNVATDRSSHRRRRCRRRLRRRLRRRSRRAGSRLRTARTAGRIHRPLFFNLLRGVEREELCGAVADRALPVRMQRRVRCARERGRERERLAFCGAHARRVEQSVGGGAGGHHCQLRAFLHKNRVGVPVAQPKGRAVSGNINWQVGR